MAGPTGSGKCQHNISTMVKVCRELGFAVNPSKVTAPSPVTCFLGIDIDSCKGVACIDPECLQVITQELVRFQTGQVSNQVGNTFPHWQASFHLQGVPPGPSIPVQDDRGVQEGPLPTSPASS